MIRHDQRDAATHVPRRGGGSDLDGLNSWLTRPDKYSIYYGAQYVRHQQMTEAKKPRLSQARWA